MNPLFRAAVRMAANMANRTNRPRCSRSRRFLRQLILSCILATPGICGAGTRTLTVDLSQSLKASTPMSSGFLGEYINQGVTWDFGIYGTGAVGLADSLIDYLRPSSLNAGMPAVGHADDRSNESYRIFKNGGVRMIHLQAPWPWITGTNDPHPRILHPSQPANWELWVDWVRAQIDTALAERSAYGYEFEVGIWHEPHWVAIDTTWDAAAGTTKVSFDFSRWDESYPNSERLYYEMWHAMYDTVKAIDPTIPVIGPGITGMSVSDDALWTGTERPEPGTWSATEWADSIWTWYTDKYNLDPVTIEYPSLAGFAAYCDSVGQWPDHINWHSVKFDWPNHPGQHLHLNDLRVEADSIQTFLSQFSGAPTSGFRVTEAIGKGQYLAPGALVWCYQTAEEASVDFGVDYVSRTIHIGYDPAHADTANGIYDPYDMETRALTGLVEPDMRSENLNRPRNAWWLTRYYANLGEGSTGSYVRVPESDSSLAALAAKSSADRAAVLIGSYFGDPPDSITVVFRNLSSVSGLVIDDIVEANLQWITGDTLAALVGGVDESDFEVASWDQPRRYFVEGDSLEIVFTGDSVPDSLGAVHLVLTPPVFKSVSATQFSNDLEVAMNAVEIGDTVRVSAQAQPYPPITMRRRIALVATGTGSPPVSVEALAGSTAAVVFPPGTDSKTLLRGFDILSGPDVTSVVRMEGPGWIDGCTVSNRSGGTETLVEVSANDTRVSGLQAVCDSTWCLTSPGVALTASGDSTIIEDSRFLFEASGAVVVSTAITISGLGTNLSDSWILGDGAVIGVDGTSADSMFVSGCTLVNVYQGILADDQSGIFGCTVDTTYLSGIDLSSGGTAERCIVANCSLASGVEGGAGSLVNYCIAPDGFSGGTQTGCSTDDPMCPISGSHEIKLGSYGDPNGNPTGLLIGSQPVGCFLGDLGVSTTHQGPLTLIGIASIADSLSLELEAGTVVTAIDDPVSTAGLLSVEGVLLLSGANGDSVTIGGSGTPGDWDGILVHAGSKLGAQYVSICDAVECIYTSDSTPVDSVGLSHVFLSNFLTGAVRLEGSGGTDPTFQGNNVLVDLSGAASGVGIVVDTGGGGASGYTVDLAEIAISGESGDAAGLVVNSEGAGSARAELSQIGISGLTTGVGLEVDGYAPKIHDVTVTNCKWGIKLLGDSTPDLMKYDYGDTVVITGCTTGLYVGDSSTPTVGGVGIVNPSGGTGLYTASSSGGSYSDLRISGGSYGVQAYGTDSHSIRDSRIAAFTAQGVKVGVAGDIDLGTSGDHGENDIHSSESSVTKYVSAKSHLGSLGPVPAIQNWWGADPPSSSMFTPSQVSYTPWNGSAYHTASLEDRIGVVQLPFHPVPTLGFSPNPFRGGGEIYLAIPGGTAYNLELYSPNGRLVRSVDVGYVTRDQETKISWDGMDNGGRRVAAGVYFLRLTAGSEILVRKIVRLP